MSNTKIWLSSPHMGGDELSFVKTAFDQNWVAPLGPNVDNFESDLAQYVQIRQAAALTSGTAAIHLALILLGVQSEDEVLCQSFTFSASANPIAYQGALPIFIDSEVDTWNMDPCLLREAIEDRISHGKKPKAIIAVHLYGMPAKMSKILSISKEYGIPVIEDAAEALGSRIGDKRCGSFGDFGVLSFNGNKIITTSGGGALLSNNEEFIAKARFLATQARDDAPWYQHSQIGFNYRMSNIVAGIGRGQMMVLDSHIAKRRANFEYYKTKLEPHGFVFLKEPNEYYSNRWLTSVQVPEPAKTRKNDIQPMWFPYYEACKLMDIETRPLWKPMHRQPIFKNVPFYGNGISEALFDRGLCLPSGSNLSTEDLDRVICALKSVV